MAELTKATPVPTKRNCACFTPDGVIYTKIKTKRNYERYLFVYSIFIDDETNCLFRFLSSARLAERPRRVVRSLDQDEFSEMIEYQRPTSTMEELLRISHSIDDIEGEIGYDQRLNETVKRRQKRDTDNYMNNMIQVRIITCFILLKNNLKLFKSHRTFKQPWSNWKVKFYRMKTPVQSVSSK